MRATVLPMFLAIALGCGGSRPGVTAADPAAPTVPAAPLPTRSRVVSWDILEREPVASNAEVRHILIGWKDLGDSYNGQLDARAAARTHADAEKEVESVLAKLRAGEDFEAAMSVHSEDQGSAGSGRSYQVAPDAQLVIEFKQLSMRLQPGEVGVVQSDFGFHIIKRFR
jgi:PPIC-type PPIASE domain